VSSTASEGTRAGIWDPNPNRRASPFANRSAQRSRSVTTTQASHTQDTRGASFRSPQLPLQSARPHHGVRAATLALLGSNVFRSIFSPRPLGPLPSTLESACGGLLGVARRGAPPPSDQRGSERTPVGGGEEPQLLAATGRAPASGSYINRLPRGFEFDLQVA